MSPAFAALLLIDADDGYGAPLAVRFGQDDRTVAYRMREALSHEAISTAIQVGGCHGEEVLYGEAADGWETIITQEWRSGRVPAARDAMQRIPLVDGFFLSVCDDSEFLSLADHFELLSSTLLRERMNLGRIVIPTKGGQDCWPWLIDTGFRQPFVDLRDDQSLESVLEAFADQVRRVNVD